MSAKPQFTFVGSDGVEPTLKPVWPLQLSKFLIGLYEHFLGDVFRLLVISYFAIGIRMHSFLVFVYKKCKRRLIAFEAASYKHFIV